MPFKYMIYTKEMETIAMNKKYFCSAVVPKKIGYPQVVFCFVFEIRTNMFFQNLQVSNIK